MADILTDFWKDFLTIFDIFMTEYIKNKTGYEGTSDSNVLSEQNVPHQKNVLYCSVLTEHFKMFLFCSQEHFKTTENMQIHHDHVIFALNFFLNFQSPKLCTSLEIFILKTLLILDFLPYHYITLQFLF